MINFSKILTIIILVQSKLIVMGDKSKGTLGEVDLNLSLYSEGEPKYYKLPLRKCVDPEAYLEVTILGLPLPDKSQQDSPAKSTRTNGSAVDN